MGRCGVALERANAPAIASRRLRSNSERFVIPEAESPPATVASELREAYRRGKSHAIAVAAEGPRNNADALARYFSEHSEHLGFE
jgi:6-phosphofructokinase 1